MLVTIPNTKTKITRKFVIDGEFRQIVAKYESLRPPNVNSDRFFLNYQSGKCTNQVIGKNKFGNMPKQIAGFLQLPDSNLYTGHSFRRTSATLLADGGADLLTLKRHGGWTSNATAEGYVEDSTTNKQKIAKMITSSINLQQSTSKASLEIPPVKRQKIDEVNQISESTAGTGNTSKVVSNQEGSISINSNSLQKDSAVQFSNLNNCNIYINCNNKN